MKDEGGGNGEKVDRRSRRTRDGDASYFRQGSQPNGVFDWHV